MQTYLLAADLFGLTALLLGLNNFSKGRRSWRLLPLFLLVISRLLILIIFLRTSADGESLATASTVAALEVFSAACLVWALIDSLANLSEMWQRIIWLAGGAAFFLTMFPLIPEWPVPYQIHSIIIAVFGAPLILISLGRIGWVHLATVLILAMANLLSLPGLVNVSWLVLLLAYGFLIGALHWESLQTYRDRQKTSEAVAQEAISLSRERQRLLEVSEVISAVPGLDQAMMHIARSMAHITHSDQSAIFVLDVDVEDQARLVAVYSPERPIDLTYHDQITIKLADCIPLQSAIDKQVQQVLLAHQNDTFFSEDNFQGTQPTLLQMSGIAIFEDTDSYFEIEPSSLSALYTLWNEKRSGPTLIQPLTVQGQSIGALILGNPVTHRSIRENDRALCSSLASQIATIVESYRRYVDLELQVEALTELPWDLEPETEIETGSGSEIEIESEPEPEWEAEIESEPEKEPFPELVLAPSDEVVTAGELNSSMETMILEPVGPALDVTGFASSREETTAKPLSASTLQIELGYLSILETVDDGVVVSNAKGRVRLVNTAAERILGKARRELLDQPIGTIYGEIDAGGSIEDLATAFSRRNEPLPTYYEDDDRAIEGRLIPWRNAAQEWLGIIAVFRDVTHEIKSDKARNNTITALSRVLRGPLGIIKGYAELITDGSIGEYSSEQLRVQQIIHSNSERMAEILENAIQISLQNKRELLPNFEEIDARQVINEVIREFTPLIQLSELELVQEIKPGLLPIVADRKHLYRILENLLSNACRFTPPGGQVTLRAWVQQEREGNVIRPHLLLAVADNGVGMPQAELKRIFDPFYQLGNQKPDELPGLGMGLAVVKELVEWHNGRVWAESMPGEGTIFQVALPLRHH